MMSDEAQPTVTGESRVPQTPPPPIRSRFLFVDVAAQRAKQLRRGALPRLPQLQPDPATGQRPPVTGKMERIAMDEVRQGLVEYELPNDRHGTHEGPE